MDPRPSRHDPARHRSACPVHARRGVLMTARRMPPLRLLTVVGARPQFIKAATMSRAIAAAESVVEVMVHTGQHFDADMSDVFFEELEIPPPAYHLGIHGGSHGDMTGRMLQRLEAVMGEARP